MARSHRYCTGCLIISSSVLLGLQCVDRRTVSAWTHRHVDGGSNAIGMGIGAIGVAFVLAMHWSRGLTARVPILGGHGVRIAVAWQIFTSLVLSSWVMASAIEGSIGSTGR